MQLSISERFFNFGNWSTVNDSYGLLDLITVFIVPVTVLRIIKDTYLYLKLVCTVPVIVSRIIMDT